MSEVEAEVPTGATKDSFNGYLTNQMSAGRFGWIGAAFKAPMNRKLKSAKGQVC